MTAIDEVWNSTIEYAHPRIKYALGGGKTWYLVIKDNSTVYELINSEGMIYAIVASKCIDMGNYYEIDQDYLHITSCSGNLKSYSTLQEWAYNFLLPVFKTLS